MGASERGLRPAASPESFGAAMVTCEGYAPACSDLGRCERNGECFKSLEWKREVCARQIERLANIDGGQAGWLFKNAAAAIRDGSISSRAPTTPKAGGE